MSKTRGGVVYHCNITGVLGRSEEPSPRFTITGNGYETSSSEGNVTKTTQKEIFVGTDLRDENLFLGGVPLGTVITWTECRGKGSEDFLHSCSIKVVHPGRGAGKKR